MMANVGSHVFYCRFEGLKQYLRKLIYMLYLVGLSHTNPAV